MFCWNENVQCRPHIWNSMENSMACVSCYVLLYCRFDVMWCDVIMLKFNFISSVLLFFSFITIERANEWTIRIVEHFFFSHRIRYCCFWVMMSDLYCHWTSAFLTHSLNHSLTHSLTLSRWIFVSCEGNLKMCRFDPITRQSIDLVFLMDENQWKWLRMRAYVWER